MIRAAGRSPMRPDAVELDIDQTSTHTWVMTLQFSSATGAMHLGRLRSAETTPT
jgi:hypothetical protein